MHDDNKILFTNDFQALYRHLGVLGFMDARGGGRGVSPEAFARETSVYKTTTSSSLRLLKQSGIVREENGMLQLDRCRFYSMSLWDLLLIAEPWLGKAGAPPGTTNGQQSLVNFCRSENLSRSYLP